MKQAVRLVVSVLTLTSFLAPSAIHPAEQEATPSVVTEKVTVTATRLPDDTRLDDVPGHVTIIDRLQIERSGAGTLQALLVREAGFTVHDQVGNDLQTTLALRGLGGSGTKVFLDGAPINDPRNNTLSLELISLDSLERIEIVRGTAASLAGGGAHAGAIHLISRHGSERVAGEISVSAGSYDTTRLGGEVGGRGGQLDYFFTASTEDTNGYRANSGGDTTRLAGTLGTELPGGRRLELAAMGSAIDRGNPGALTAEEVAVDPTGAPFNALDFTEQAAGQLSLNFHGLLRGPWTVAANVFLRDRSTESLTTGRSAASFGGFFLDADESSVGSTVQLSHDRQVRKTKNRLTIGLEWLDSDTAAEGFATPPGDPGHVDPASLASDNTTQRRTAALFVQNTWRPVDAWSFMLGVRGDRDRVGYDERFPAAASDDARTFSEISLRAGANWNPGERLGYYVSYGEAYLPPTVEQMYSFPTFGSNPGLEPEDSESIEVGLRLAGGDGPSMDVALFRIAKDNEIVFDPGSVLGSFGANVNAGRTRRDGVEARVRGRAGQNLGFFASLTLIDAEFQSGADSGRDVPLVPDVQVAAGLDADLTASLTLTVDGLYVGEQVLDNDAAGTQPQLDDYAVWNARLAWEMTLGARAGGRDRLELFVEGRNLFDEAYATRGIYAFDFSTFVNDTFLTPAPGRRYQAGARYKF